MAVSCPLRESPTSGGMLTPFAFPGHPERDVRNTPLAPYDVRATRRVDDPDLEVGDRWTTIYNISLGGMCIVSLRRLAVGQVTTFELHDRGSRQWFMLKGEVVSEQPVTGDLRKLEIRWIALEGEARDWLSAYLR